MVPKEHVHYVRSVSKKIGHVPLNRSKVASKFLQFTNHHIREGDWREIVNDGIGLGLKIPANYFFMGMQDL